MPRPCRSAARRGSRPRCTSWQPHDLRTSRRRSLMKSSTRNRAILLCVVATLFAASLASASSQADEAKTSDKHQDEAERRLARIKAEIARLRDHEWAGEYYWGDGLGANVSLVVSPKSGFVFTWNGCMGLYDV